MILRNLLPPALLTAASIAALSAGAARAQTFPLAGPGDFSGAEVLVVFDDLGAGFGAEVPAAGGVELGLANGNPPRYLPVTAPREFGPADSGSINNFWQQPFPYPGLTLRFPMPVQRVGFELRVNDLDDVTLTPLSGGAPLDAVSLGSRGIDQFYFYGVGNAAGFDELRIDVGPVTGTLSLDNLSFEAGLAETGPAVLSCEGFRTLGELASDRLDPDRRRLLRWKRLWHRLARWLGVRLLHARLSDAEGVAMTDADLASPPVVRVEYQRRRDGERVDVTGRVLDGASPALRFHRRAGWWFPLPRRGLRAPGLFRVTLEPGDPDAYVIDPTCARWFANRRHGWRRD